MYKDKIKNKLQKLYHRGIDLLPDNHQNVPFDKISPTMFESSRKSKLSLSKDLSVASNNSIDHQQNNKKSDSLSRSKKSYIRVVSNSAQKDLSCLSSSKICINNKQGASERLSKKCPNNQNKCIFFEDEVKTKSHKKKISNFNAGQIRDMAFNIAKSAAILNQKIVPVLLQAATISGKNPKVNSYEDNLASIFLASINELKQSAQNYRYDLLQSPINHLKDESFDEDSQFVSRKAMINRCETEPNNPTQKLKNQHKIQHSPTPIKTKSTRNNHFTPQEFIRKHSQRNRAEESCIITDYAKEIVSMHPLAQQLEIINCERKAVQSRITIKLDQLSNKAHSIVKQHSKHSENEEQQPKKPKILSNSSKINIIKQNDKNSPKKNEIISSKIPQNIQKYEQNNHPSQRKTSKMRKLIIDRIFS